MPGFVRRWFSCTCVVPGSRQQATHYHNTKTHDHRPHDQNTSHRGLSDNDRFTPITSHNPSRPISAVTIGNFSTDASSHAHSLAHMETGNRENMIPSLLMQHPPSTNHLPTRVTAGTAIVSDCFPHVVHTSMQMRDSGCHAAVWAQGYFCQHSLWWSKDETSEPLPRCGRLAQVTLEHFFATSARVDAEARAGAAVSVLVASARKG